MSGFGVFLGGLGSQGFRRGWFLGSSGFRTWRLRLRYGFEGLA